MSEPEKDHYQNLGELIARLLVYHDGNEVGVGPALVHTYPHLITASAAAQRTREEIADVVAQVLRQHAGDSPLLQAAERLLEATTHSPATTIRMVTARKALEEAIRQEKGNE